MNRHLTDADLVAIVLLPEESPEERMHLASCDSCARRRDVAVAELERQRREHDDSIESRDATFWKRQELNIMREVSRSSRPAATRRSFIAAALVTFAIGGFWFGRASVDSTPTASPAPVAIATTTTAGATVEQEMLVPTAVSTDPWESDQLNEFQAVVDWESWVDEDRSEEGTI